MLEAQVRHDLVNRPAASLLAWSAQSGFTALFGPAIVGRAHVAALLLDRGSELEATDDVRLLPGFAARLP